MKKMNTIQTEREKLLNTVRKTLKQMRILTAGEIESLKQGIAVLQELRKKVYEDINQLQHAGLILDALDWLRNVGGFGSSEIEWNWHPHQTGGNEDPDLRGCIEERPIVVAEITASHAPIGTIDTRMRDTLGKLSSMKGEKFYFVRTESMERRAKTKVSKMLDQVIQIIRIP